MQIKDIRALTGLNITDFTRRYEIPYRTYHDWEVGKANPPAYVVKLLERVVREDFKK